MEFAGGGMSFRLPFRSSCRSLRGLAIENGKDTWYAHSGNEDWLGHSSLIRFTPSGDIVVVLSNAGDIEDTGWATRINRVIRREIDAH